MMINKGLPPYSIQNGMAPSFLVIKKKEEDPNLLHASLDTSDWIYSSNPERSVWDNITHSSKVETYDLDSLIEEIQKNTLDILKTTRRNTGRYIWFNPEDEDILNSLLNITSRFPNKFYKVGILKPVTSNYVPKNVFVLGYRGHQQQEDVDVPFVIHENRTKYSRHPNFESFFRLLAFRL